MHRAFTIHNGYLYLKAAVSGIFCGLMVTAYRAVLEYAGDIPHAAAAGIKSNALLAVPVFAALGVCAGGIGFLVKRYPMIKGGGIPQVKGALNGYFSFRWLPELLAKFGGGIVALICGLSLGKAGPLVQIGAYTASGTAELSRGKGRPLPKEKSYLLLAGSAAGFAAAFNAPLAGIVFAFEELRYRLSHTVLVCVMLSCMTAEIVTELLIGQSTAFSFTFSDLLPVRWYPLLLPLGAFCGMLAALFNRSLLLSLSVHEKITAPALRPLPAFLTAGIVLILFPPLLGTGAELLNTVQAGGFTAGMLVILIAGKLLFTALSYGSGAPGGIFFPLLILGALTGKFYHELLVMFMGIPQEMGILFIILGMTAFFSGVTRAPITGCILISEMAGSISHLIPLIIISLTGYGIAKYCGAEPIYDQLLRRMLKNSGGEKQVS